MKGYSCYKNNKWISFGICTKHRRTFSQGRMRKTPQI